MGVCLALLTAAGSIPDPARVEGSTVLTSCLGTRRNHYNQSRHRKKKVYCFVALIGK